MIKKLTSLIFIYVFIQAPAQADLALDALKNTGNKGYSRAEKIREFNFPQDHGAHRDFQTEWWYATGNLEDKSGNKFGYQLTIFRNNIDPNFSSNSSGLKSNQIYMGHFAISDIKNKKFYSYEIFQRESAGLAGSSKERTWIDDWVFNWEPLKLFAKHQDLELDLELKAVKQIVLQGNRGLSQKSEQIGNASYYYSIPRLESAGKIKINNQEYQVKGESWIDREWSTSSLGKDETGWDWFSLQLSDNYELMYYQIRKKSGISPMSLGALIDTNSQKTSFNSKDIKLSVLEYWTSPKTKIKYPAKWRLVISKLNLDLEITPLINNQEHQFQYSYWEGAVSIKGSHAGKPINGKGYVELTGYK
jgi:predicted secreted hydrolase